MDIFHQVTREQLEIIVATKNRGKVREIRRALKGLGLKIYSLNDFLDIPEIEENGKSFTENALKKARFYSKYFKKLAIADDSGLEVDSLKGLPGIYSARYSGEGASDREKNQKLLGEMKGIPVSKRGARFKCVIAMVSHDGREVVAEGSCRGKIGFREVGKKGFGYDPIFILPQYGKTMAQLTLEEKDRVSHRGKALRKLKKIIVKRLEFYDR
jgi:XTP/dITP diphosphohydrolase